MPDQPSVLEIQADVKQALTALDKLAEALKFVNDLAGLLNGQLGAAGGLKKVSNDLRTISVAQRAVDQQNKAEVASWGALDKAMAAVVQRRKDIQRLSSEAVKIVDEKQLQLLKDIGEQSQRVLRSQEADRKRTETGYRTLGRALVDVAQASEKAWSNLGGAIFSGAKSSVDADEKRMRVLGAQMARVRASNAAYYRDQIKKEEDKERAKTAPGAVNFDPLTDEGVSRIFQARSNIFSFNGGANLLALNAQLLLQYKLLGSIFSAMQFGTTFVENLDKELTQLQAIVGLTNTQMGKLKTELVAVSQGTRFTAVEITQAAVTLGQAGFSSDQIQKSIKDIALLATATGSTLATAVDIATSAVNVFNLTADDTGLIANTVTAALNRTKLTMEQFQTAFTYVANVAAESNISFNEISAALGAMANAGIKSGSTIGTGLRQVLIDLQNPSQKLQDTLKRLGVSLEQINVPARGLTAVMASLRDAGFTTADAFQVFEKRGAAAFAALEGQAATMNELQQAFTYTNAAAEANSVQMEGLANKFARFSSSVGVFIDKLAGPFVDVLKSVLDGLTGIVNFLGKFETALKIIGGVIAAVTVGLLAWAGGALLAGIIAMGARAAATATAFLSVETSVAAAARSVLSFGSVLGVVSALGTALAELVGITSKSSDELEKSKTAAGDASQALAAHQDVARALEKEIERLSLRSHELSQDTKATQTAIIEASAQFAKYGLNIAGVGNDIYELIKRMQQLRTVNEKAGIELLRTGVATASGELKARQDVLQSNAKAVGGTGLLNNPATVGGLSKDLRSDVAGATATIQKFLSDASKVGFLPTDEGFSGLVSSMAILERAAKDSKTNGATRSVILEYLSKLEVIKGAASGVLGSNATLSAANISLNEANVRQTINAAKKIDGKTLAEATTELEQKISELNSFSKDLGKKGVLDPIGTEKKFLEKENSLGIPGLRDAISKFISETLTKDERAALNATVDAALSQVEGSRKKEFDIQRAAAERRGIQFDAAAKAAGTRAETAANRGAQATTIDELIRQFEEQQRQTKLQASLVIQKLEEEARASQKIDEFQGTKKTIELNAQIDAEKEKLRETLQKQRLTFLDNTFILRDFHDATTGLTALARARRDIDIEYADATIAATEAMARSTTTSTVLSEALASRNAELRNPFIAGAQFKNTLAGQNAQEGLLKAEGTASSQQVDSLTALVARYRSLAEEATARRQTADREFALSKELNAERSEQDKLEAQAVKYAEAEQTAKDALLKIEIDLTNATERRRKIELAIAGLRANDTAGVGQRIDQEFQNFIDKSGSSLVNFNQLVGTSFGLILDQMHTGFGTFLQDMVKGTKTVGQAFSDLFATLTQKALDFVANQAISQIFSLVGSALGFSFTPTGGSGNLVPNEGALFAPLKSANGGLIRGFANGGHPGMDSLLAMLMPGEFVTRKSAVDSVGVGFMNDLNNQGAGALKKLGNVTINAAQPQPTPINLWVAHPTQIPPPTKNDVIAMIDENVLTGGVLKQRIKQVMAGA